MRSRPLLLNKLQTFELEIRWYPRFLHQHLPIHVERTDVAGRFTVQFLRREGYDDLVFRRR